MYLLYCDHRCVLVWSPHYGFDLSRFITLVWAALQHFLSSTFLLLFLSLHKKSSLIGNSSDLVSLPLTVFLPDYLYSSFDVNMLESTSFTKEIIGGLNIQPSLFLFGFFFFCFFSPIHLYIHKGHEWRITSEIQQALWTKNCEKLIGLKFTFLLCVRIPCGQRLHAVHQ